MEVSLFDIYDLAEEGEKGTYWNFMYLGEELAIQIQDEYIVYAWFQNAQDTDNMFDTRDYDGPVEFENAIAEWVENV